MGLLFEMVVMEQKLLRIARRAKQRNARSTIDTRLLAALTTCVDHDDEILEDGLRTLCWENRKKRLRRAKSGVYK